MFAIGDTSAIQQGMAGSEDKLAAIANIEQGVYAQLNKGGTPLRLAAILFQDLRSAINNGGSSGAPLARETAAERVKKYAKDTAFKSAVTTIAEKLQNYRPDAGIPSAHDRLGTACIKANIDGQPHWAIVRGPCDEHRGVQENLVLKLTAEFSPIASVQKLQSQLRHPERRDGDSAGEFPDQLKPYMRLAADDLFLATHRFNDNDRLRELMWQHVNSLADNFQSEFERLRLGEIRTDYDEVKLLTACVEKLCDGDELLGLTNWQTDEEWWQSEEASRFLAANEAAIKQKALIRRIFVHASSESLEERSLRITEMDRHCALGVKVGYIARNALPENTPELASQCVLRSNAPTPHSWLTYRVELAHHGKWPLRNIFSINPNEIRLNEQLLRGLWRNASKHR